MSTPVRVAIANDYEIVVLGITAALAPYSDRVAVVELDSGTPVVSDVDIILYDSFGQPQADHLDLDAITGDSSARVVVFTWNVEPATVDVALARGVAGVLGKALGAEELVDALERVHAGETVRPVGDPAADTFGRWPGDEHGLSARESEVLALICQGLSNQGVTERAFIGINTVKTHIRSLYRKIGADSRSQAVRWGLTHGFTPDHTRHVTDEAERPGTA
ncbi:response regulator transcription factor [soil metagenome]